MEKKREIERDIYRERGRENEREREKYTLFGGGSINGPSNRGRLVLTLKLD